MTGKERAINSTCSSVDCAAVAARLREAAGAAEALCLTPSGAVAAEVKRHFSGCRRLPLILPMPSLLGAGRVLPLDSDLPRRAALVAVGGDDEALVWLLYEHLRPHCGGRQEAARLQLARQLAALFVEVDGCLTLAADENPFDVLGDELSHEAGVAQALWALLADEGVEVGVQPLMRRLAEALPDMGAPIIAVCDEDVTAPQSAFYERCGAEVLHLAPPSAELRWRSVFTMEGELPVECGHTAVQGVGETLSEAAAVALAVIDEWRAQLPADGRIGVVVHDRLLARRLRALAESRGLLIADTGGWRAESLSFGAALSAFASVALEGFDVNAVGEVLQSPFYAGEQGLPLAARYWHEWLAIEMQLPVDVAGALTALENLEKRAAQGKRPKPVPPALKRVLADLHEVWRGLGAVDAVAGGKGDEGAAAVRSVADWLTALRAAGAGALAAWDDDAVALAVWERLAARAAAGGGGVAPFSGGEFLLWLRDALAAENVSDAEIESRVAFVSSGARQRFDALLLLGYAGKAAGDELGWLGEGERERLGLPRRADRVESARRDFSRLLATHDCVAAVWCGVDSAGKPVEANPFWRLFAEHCEAHGRLRSLSASNAAAAGARDVDDDAADAADVVPPLPAEAVLRQPPGLLSPSMADVLMRCPYAFYGGSVLRLSDAEVADASELSPMLAGSLMHGALSAFAKKSEGLRERDALMSCWQGVLDGLHGNRSALALLRAYWRVNSKWFIDWEVKRREGGWRIAATEQRYEAELRLRDGGVIPVSGRIDRLDAIEGAGDAGDGVMAVIDYKSGALPSRKELAAGELPQLPLYAFLLRVRRDAAGQSASGSVEQKMLCRPLHKRAAVVESDADERRVAARLRRVVREMVAGAPLPANGTDAACEDCSFAGVCRREHWRV